ncbi:MAG: EAL domain-containing protein [Acidimicrobiales bacterium]
MHLEHTERSGEPIESILDILTAVLDTAVDPLVSIDAGGRIVLFSQAATRVFGYQVEEVLGHPLEILIPDRFTAEHADHVNAFATRGISTRSMGALGSVMGRRRNGEEFPAEASISRVETDSGLIMTASIRDLSAREEEERRFRTLFENAIAGIIHTDIRGRLLTLNPEMARMLGYDSPDQVIAEAEELAALVADPELKERLRRTATAAVRGFEVEEDLVRRDGSILTVLATGRVLRGQHGRATGVLFVAIDITERRRIESELRHSEARLQAAQALAHVGSVEWEIASGSAHWSTEVYRILGCEPGAITPSRGAYLLHVVPEDRRRLEDAVRASREEGSYDIEYSIQSTDGRRRTIHERGELVLESEGRPVRVMAAVHDVTERHRAERILEQQATHDPLTGLPNRLLLLDRINQAIERRAEPDEHHAVLFLDLDRFKVVNDSLGHNTGDELLVEAARRISDAVRSGDTVARFGGDEFVVLQERIAEPGDAELLAARLVEALSAPYIHRGRALHLGVSIGIAIAGPGCDAESLIRDADTAMYHAKASGRGQASRFTAALREQADERLQLEQDLREALDAEQLFVEYQPMVELATGRWTGVEVLVRWAHPRRGRLDPVDFIALAEETGLVSQLGGWVLETACAQLAMWDRQGLCGLELWVNLSPVQLTDPDLAASIGAVAASHGIDPSRICLEVTEHALVADPQVAHQVLTDVRGLGARVALDDFGMGAASLSHLRGFPVTDLKVDRSFVAGLMTDDGDATIVETVLAMGRTLGLTVVAEGVETPQQAAALLAHDCRYAQGHHLGPPMPPAMLAQGLVRSRSRAAVPADDCA